MRTSFNFLRSLSSLRHSTTRYNTSSASVVPIHSDYFTSTTTNSSFKSLPIKSLPSSHDDITTVVVTAAHLSDLLTSAITSSNKLTTVSKHEFNESDINIHLEDGVVLLDGCRSVLEKIEFVKEYIESVRIAVRSFERTTSPVQIKRVINLLDNKKYRTDSQFERSYSTLLKRAERLGDDENETGRELSNSRVEALKACRFLESSLSFKCKKRSSTSLSRKSSKKSVGQMAQLKEVIALAERLQNLKGEYDEESVCCVAEVLGNKCEELETVVNGLEISVKELYSELISVRMMLL